MDLAPTRALTLRRAAAEVARGPGRPARRRPDARLAPAARDPGHRAVDARDARALRPGPPRPRAGGRPRLPQARRPRHHRQPAGARRRARRCARSSTATASGRGSPASTCASPPRATCCRVSPARARPRVEPLAGQELVRQHPLGDLPPLDQALVEHPVGVALPLGRVLVAERPLGVGGEEHRQRRLHRPPPAARGRAPCRPRAALEPGRRVRLQRRVAARGGLHEAAHPRAELLVEVAPARRRRRARRRSARRASPCAGSPGRGRAAARSVPS